MENKPILVFGLILTLGAGVYGVEDKKHVEPRQYEQEPTLTTEVLISTRSGTAPTFTVIGPNQFA
jgi:hypothetical protein